MDWNSLRGDYLTFLTREEMDSIHATSLRVLKEVGLKVTNAQAFDIFADAGAEVDSDTKIVTFSENLIDDALAATPDGFIWQARDPEKNLVMRDTLVHFSPAACPPFVRDLETGEQRPATYQDCCNMVKINDALERIGDCFCPIFPTDVPPGSEHYYMMRAMAENSDKCIRGRVTGRQVALDSIRIANKITAASGIMPEGPNMIALTDTISPLRTDDEIVDGLIEFVKNGFPVILSAEMMAGGTGPASLAGTLALQNAEILSHVVLCQKINPGIPLIYGTTSSIMDMKTSMLRYGAMEMALINATTAQLARYYGMPCRGAAGCADAKELDMQAGYEVALNVLLSALAGVNYMTQSIGGMDMGLSVSYRKIMIDHEMLGSIVRCLQGVTVDEEALAYEVIKNVGPGGTFLTQMHTLQNFRREHFLADLADTTSYPSWDAKGRISLESKAAENVKEILANHEPAPLPESVVTELDAIEKEVLERSSA
ncbi:MAG: trimethylamine methyltransferase family protein [Desulfosarcinaceae bacterium]|nr:trimethylamine methyltransferase family protein [Desulfosarcinaceae bacterium]